MLECVRRVGPISRAQLARETALSKPTVSQALAGLQHAGLVREAGRSKGGKGPTAILYQLNPRAGWVVGIDIGRRFVRAAIADVTGGFVARRDERARVRSAATLIAQVGEIAHGLAADAGIRWRQVTARGGRLPRRVPSGPARGLPRAQPPGLGARRDRRARPARARDEDRVRERRNLAALGEATHGLGRGVDHLAYLHLGTGVGLGIVVHGELYRGAGGGAGEVAYLPLAGTDVEGPDSRRRGPLDVWASADGVVRAARDEGITGSLTAAKVFAAAAAGDERAGRVVAAEAERIALAVAAVSAVLDPELVILGGGIGMNAELLLDHVRGRAAELSPFRPRIEVSVLREEATLNGSVALALTAAHELLFDRTAATG